VSPPVTLFNVSKRYGRHAALRGVTLTFNAPEIVGLVGPNGAGKTSLLRIIAGLLQPSDGEVTRGRPGGPGNPGNPANNLPYCIRYFAGECSLPPDVSAGAWSRLWTGRTRQDLARRAIGTLSRGMRQQLGLEATLSIASPSAVSAVPSLVLLDEPWEGLDPDTARWLSAQLVETRGRGTTVLVSSHRIHDLAEVCDRCVFLARGLVAEEVRMSTSMAVGIDRSALLFEAFDRVRSAEREGPR
jgi:ABC-type multidrug transport system ATPase subunit